MAPNRTEKKTLTKIHALRHHFSRRQAFSPDLWWHKQRIRRGMDSGTEQTLQCALQGVWPPLVTERKWQWYQGSLDNMRGQIYRTTAKNFFSSELTASSIGFLFFSDFSTFLLCRIL
jgi:hypothetical protein